MKTNTYMHRVQIKKAQDFIRKNLVKTITLDELSKCAGASKYHFIRLFKAYLGETPLEYARRQKIEFALKRFRQDSCPITDIAFELGFDSSSSFNKLFKKLTKLNPSEFRNLGKEQQEKLIYSISITKKMEEILMKLELSKEPEIIERGQVQILSLENAGGKFDEIAPPIWEKFLGFLEGTSLDLSQSEFLGISFVDQDEKHFYKAAITVENKDVMIAPLKQEFLEKSKYAKFILKGSYDGVWPAFDMAYKTLDKMGLELADLPCLENYINDPRETPENELLTEILIPIK